jgi:hypothetical protein
MLVGELGVVTRVGPPAALHYPRNFVDSDFIHSRNQNLDIIIKDYNYLL